MAEGGLQKSADGAKTKLTGVQRAAVLLLVLGEKDAAEVMKHLGPKEVQKLGVAMASLSNVTRDIVGTVLAEFVEEIGDQTTLGLDAEAYIRNVLVGALGEDKADNLIDRIMMGRASKGMEALKWMEPRAVAEMIRVEHPQIIAIVLSYLESEHAGEVLSMLPDQIRTNVIMRIATLDGIQPSALHELDEIMEKQFTVNSSALKSSAIGGVKAAANILNNVDSSMEGEIIDSIKEMDADLGQEIQDLMFVFENLNDIDNKSMQTLLREISSETLVLALKGADESLKDKVFANMSKRAAEMLKEDLEVKGPVRISEVEAAQKEVLAVARRMADSGDLSLGGKGDEFV